MKKVLLIIFYFSLIIFAIGCSSNGSNKESGKVINENEAILELETIILNMKKIYETSESTVGSASIVYDSSFIKMIDNVKNDKNNFYLLNYVNKEKYLCGYVPTSVIKQISDFIYFADHINIISRFKTRLLTNKIQFVFEDIIWEVYDNIDDIQDIKEGYELYFSYRINEVEFINDIFNKSINKKIIHYNEIKIHKQDDKFIINEINNLRDGKYLIYFKKIDFENNFIFNEVYTDLYLYRGVQSFYVREVKEINNKLILVEEDESISIKYKFFESEFEEIIIEYEKTTIGDVKLLLNFEEYMKLVIKLIKN